MDQKPSVPEEHSNEQVHTVNQDTQAIVFQQP